MADQNIAKTIPVTTENVHYYRINIAIHGVFRHITVCVEYITTLTIGLLYE